MQKAEHQVRRTTHHQVLACPCASHVYTRQKHYIRLTNYHRVTLHMLFTFVICLNSEKHCLTRKNFKRSIHRSGAQQPDCHVRHPPSGPTAVVPGPLVTTRRGDDFAVPPRHWSDMGTGRRRPADQGEPCSRGFGSCGRWSGRVTDVRSPPLAPGRPSARLRARADRRRTSREPARSKDKGREGEAGR